MESWLPNHMYLINQMIKYGKLSYNRHLTVATGGNLSVQCDEGIIITASGTCLGNLEPSDFILLSISGDVLYQPDKKMKPSKEGMLHLTLYKHFPQIQSVVHLHPPYLVSYSCANMRFPRITSSAINKLPKEIIVDPAPAGSSSLVHNLETAIHNTSIYPKFILLTNHGTITTGSSVQEAYYTAELAEECAHIAFLSNFIIKT